MPYTTSQLQTVSRYVRRWDMPLSVSDYAIRSAISMLRNYEKDSKWFVEVAIYATRTIECEHCGEICAYVDKEGEIIHRYPDEEVYIDGYQYCTRDCAYDDGYVVCERCGEWIHGNFAVEVGEQYYCSDYCAERDGYIRCGHCDEWVHYTDAWDVHDESWCESCANDEAARCVECGERFPIDDMHYADYGNYYCENCYGSQYLHEYGFTPELQFYGGTPWAPKVPLFLGVELETDGGRDRGLYVNELANIDGFNERFWMTEDSSLSNGVEITSHPMTLEYHVNTRDLYKEVGALANKYHFGSHNGGRCGLHIHVNRSFFGKSSVARDAGGYKMLRLLQRFEKQFIIFSRRTNSQISDWCDYKTYRDYSLKSEVKISKANDMDNFGPFQMAYSMIRNERKHGQALNFEHHETFEFRIFRGTLKWSTYYACLALVDGMCRTAKSHGSTWVENVDWYTLIDTIVDSVSVPFAKTCLTEYLADKGLR